MGEFRFAMIGSLLRELILRKTMFLRTADRRFQNGHRVIKMAPRCVFGWIPRYTSSENGHRMEDLRWTVSFKPIGTH